MKYLFIHGWAMTPAFWFPLVKALKIEKEAHFIDFGFFKIEPHPRVYCIDGPSKSHDILESVTPNTVIVTHSFGSLWALKNLSKKPLALVICNGFWQYAPPIEADVINQMIMDIQQGRVGKLIKKFWQDCGLLSGLLEDVPTTNIQGVNSFAKSLPSLNMACTSQLIEGLIYLKTISALNEAKQFQPMMKVVGGGQDQIVPSRMFLRQWRGYQPLMLKSYGHELPIKGAKSLAELIRTVIKNNTKDNIEGVYD